jgi:putative tricarboxylic transport membrane protein
MRDKAGPESGLSTRWLELIVAMCFAAIGAVVVTDSLRVGAGWGEDGPKAGYFPFYIGILLIIVGILISIQTVRQWQSLSGKVATSSGQLRSVISVLLPMIVYVGLVAWLGIYVASALYIGAFMAVVGRYKRAAIVVPIAVVVTIFLIFEKWFLVALPKGPLEALIGL